MSAVGVTGGNANEGPNCGDGREIPRYDEEKLNNFQSFNYANNNRVMGYY